VLVVLGALATLGHPRVACAADGPLSRETESSNDARVAELNESGAKHYAKRNYRLAIESFIEAYAIDHDPNLLFNIARCYEELGETAAAIEKYSAFLAAPGADAEGRLRAEASLRALKQLESDGASGEAAREKAERSSSEESPSAGSEQRSGVSPLLKWGALGGGVVLAGVGGTLYYLGARDHAEVTNTAGYGDPSAVYPMTRAEAQALVDSGETKKIIGGIGIGLGGALIVTSVVLFVTGAKSDGAEKSALSFELAPGPRALAASLSGRF
jgi:tetratricopeptide (TPR) repeat protein